MAMKPFEDPNNYGNSAEHHTGKECVEKDCTRPAGTAWSPYWCFECNVERINRISEQMDALVEGVREI